MNSCFIRKNSTNMILLFPLAGKLMIYGDTLDVTKTIDLTYYFENETKIGVKKISTYKYEQNPLFKRFEIIEKNLVLFFNYSDDESITNIFIFDWVKEKVVKSAIVKKKLLDIRKIGKKIYATHDNSLLELEIN